MKKWFKSLTKKEKKQAEYNFQPIVHVIEPSVKKVTDYDGRLKTAMNESSDVLAFVWNCVEQHCRGNWGHVNQAFMDNALKAGETCRSFFTFSDAGLTGQAGGLTGIVVETDARRIVTTISPVA